MQFLLRATYSTLRQKALFYAWQFFLKIAFVSITEIYILKRTWKLLKEQKSWAGAKSNMY